jgi:midasin (ATPase involved in ribosome maturation)
VKIQPIDIAKFYLAVRKEAAAGGLFDGAGHRVHYNMRVLVRALK